MVIIDEKSLHPPPPYLPSSTAPPPFRSSHHRGGLGTLPSHILLHIVYMTFPQTPGFDVTKLEGQRRTLYWLAVSLRHVNRAFYLACMHVLRSTYLPAYQSFIRAPYTSDPFPHMPADSHDQAAPASPLDTVQRETRVLDLFIALKVREDVLMDESELHLEREERFKDLFDLNQPRSRLEDLVRIYGLREGVLFVGPPPRRSRSSGKPLPLPFSALSISFSTRRVGLVLTTESRRKRTIVEVPRTRDEKLEVAAKKLVKELASWLYGSR